MFGKTDPANQVIKDFSIEVHRGDKIGIIGSNGRGKTTLVKMMAGSMPPDKGAIANGHQVQLSYFPKTMLKSSPKKQNQTVSTGSGNAKKEFTIRIYAARWASSFLEARMHLKPLQRYLEGDCPPRPLAGIMLSDHNVLIMDEPNNHLDLEAVSALAWGLHEYKGTAIVVSHDRDLIDKVANRIIAFEADGIYIFNGPLEEYLATKNKPK